MTPEQQADAVRRAAGLFRLSHRSVIAVRGGDRVRWLGGMVSGDVASLEASPERSGCAALLLTEKGRIVADLQVLQKGEEFWLDLDRAVADSVLARLNKFIIADDVTLEEQRAQLVRLAVEGPLTRALFEQVLGGLPALSPECCAEVTLAGAPVTLAAFGVSGEPALQLFAPAHTADAVAGTLLEAGAESGLLEASIEALEILRIEAGVPRAVSELDETVLPSEARLERAVAVDKGCYTGQEVVERLRTQGQVSHLLIGLAHDGDELPEVGAPLFDGEARVGEITSACRSPRAGAIALGFARRTAAEPGRTLSASGHGMRVVSLPFVRAGT